ncbi:MAG: ABC transporter ATPase [Flavobacteriaceae bacterium]|nr:ABC transporter ATPase [Flavobacteriaceae bacterium]
MFVDFKDLSDNSRVWIYQSGRQFTSEEIKKVSERLQEFIRGWKAHGADLKASFQIKYNQFIILAVDENHGGATGCSIDASVHTIQELEKELDVDLMNKMKVSFKDGENINTVSMQHFKEFAKQDKIKADTLVFNNMVTSKAEFESAWEVAASQSWHARFLN